MHPLDAAITTAASRQHGLITRAQLVELGVDPTLAHRRRAAGQWSSVAPGVFIVGGARRDLLQRIMTTQLAAGPGAVVSHRTALHLWGLRFSPSVPLEVTIPRGRSHRRRGVVVHESGDLDRASPVEIEGITVTGLARSLLDLGAVAPADVRRAVWAARRTHGIGWDALLRALVDHARSGRRGIGPLRRVVAGHYAELATDSATEDLAYGLLVDAARVPRPDKQVQVRCADGVVVTADLGWPTHRALVEIQGIDHFTNEDLQHVDLHRRNQLELAGYTVLAYSGRLLRRRPDQFVADVEQLLGRSPGFLR